MSDASTIIGLIVAMAGGSTLLASGFEPPQLWAEEQAEVSENTLKPELGHDGRLYLAALINGQEITFLLDTAATRTLISDDDARALGITILGETSVRTVGGTIPAYEGRATSLRVGSIDLAADANVIVVEDLPHPLFGMDLIKALGSNSIAL